MKYSVDTNVFINLSRYYPRDIFPSVWEWVEILIASGEIRAISEVKTEIENGSDDLVNWSKMMTDLYVPLDLDIQAAVREIMAKYINLVNANSPKKKSQMDPFVIALAKVNSCAVVSNERRSNDLNTPKIPDVCDDMGIPFFSFFEMARVEGRKF